MDELEAVTSELADLYGQEVVAYVAYRRKYLQSLTSLMRDQGKSATEAKLWAEADAIVLQEAHLVLKAEIAALTERRDFLRSVREE